MRVMNPFKKSIDQIVVAGQSQCEKFAQICLVADYLAQNLPDFGYKRIEKSVLDWKSWLCKINQKNSWHHMGTLLVWKELLMEGSKPYYIGGAPEFLDYCYSYYKLDTFLASDRFEDLVTNYAQLQRKHKLDHHTKYLESNIKIIQEKKTLTVCISGAAYPLALHVISELLDTTYGSKSFTKIYIYDKRDMPFLESLEGECYYVGSNTPSKVVKCVEKIGLALTNSDLLIILDHYPFNPNNSIGSWLYKNKKLMENLAFMINASAPPHMGIILPNQGPACYNATILCNAVTNVKKKNIVVATSDLGLDVASIAAKIFEVPLRNMFCPPVWGFVGINHLVDIKTTVHKYNSFDPLNRFAKVRNSTLCIGTMTPEMRTVEYLTYFDKSLWLKKAQNNGKKGSEEMSKAVALLNVIKLWFLDSSPNQIISLGISGNGSFGLHFKGVFSQPAHFVNGEWKPAANFLKPKDSQMTLNYLDRMAEIIMNLGKQDLPPYCSAE